MDLGATTKPAAVLAPQAPARGENILAPGSVRTELPARSVVTAPKAAEKVRYEPTDSARDSVSRDLALRAGTRRQMDIDEATSAIVTQVIDEQSGKVVRQVPEEALLRLRAYNRESIERSTDLTSANSAEPESSRIERVA
jgi:flagellar protein FlaG